MNRRIMDHPIVMVTLLLVCLAKGSSSVGLAGQEDPPNEGIPRPMYGTNYTPGTRVVLLDETADLGRGIEVGMTGIILCCDSSDCTQRVLVSWNLWRGGVDEEAACVTPLAGLYPPGSAVWVDPSRVRLGLPFNETGILQGGDGDCLYLYTGVDGHVYRLMVSPASRQKWWVILPGGFFRVRGLLSTLPSGDACTPADGEVYHPIFSGIDWDTTRHSWDRGPFFNGDRVVLVAESDPYDARDLRRGATGTVICRNPNEERSILVSWDLWDNGGDENAYLTCFDRMAGMFPPDSTWWVAPLDVASYFQSNCGTLERTLLCCDEKCEDEGLVGLFVRFQDVYCLPDISVDDPLPTALVQAVGLYSPYEELMNPNVETPADPALRSIGGVILDSLVVPCHVPNCCDPPYVAGERVRLLVNQPGGAEGLSVGHGGKVVCCNPNDPITPILVSWDDWTGGGVDYEACETPAEWFLLESGWWMACTEIRRVVLADLYDKPEYRRLLPTTIQQGKHLQIKAVIGNQGGMASGPFTISIYLSPDDRIGADDYRLTQLSMNIAAGGWMPMSSLIVIPTFLPPGDYYVALVLDSDNEVEEEDENNNTVFVDGLLTVTE